MGRYSADQIQKTYNILGYLGSYAEKWKMTVMSDFMSAGPSIRVAHLGCQWMDFREIWYSRFFFE